jgi:PAS domain S-box-containing protein
MSSTGHLPELDLLRNQVADLARELAERDRALHEQTRHLCAAQTLAHLGSWEWDIRSGHVDWSDEMYRIFGYEPNTVSITVDTFLAVILPDDHDRILASVNEALAGKTSYDQECRIVRPNGEVRTIHCRGDVLRDVNGLPLRMSGSALDITERKGTELALQQREAHYRALIEHSSDVITILELDGTIRFESPSCERLLGYAPHELNGRIAFEFIHKDDLPAVAEKFQLLIQNSDTSQIAEFRFRRNDGSWLKLEGIGRAITDPEGRRCVIVNSRDITDRKRAETMLRTSEEKLGQALQASGTGLWEWNTATNEVVFSREWKRQLGHEESELPDSFETWETRLHPDDRDGALAYLRAYLIRPEGDYRQEFRLQHKDGTYRWIEARASLVTETDGRQVRLLGSHTDITDRKRMEEASRESEERYRALVELSPSGVFVFCEGRTVYINHMGAIMMGAKDPKEVLDRPTFEFIHPDFHQDVRDNVTRLLSGGVSVHSAERIYVKMDGTPIPVQVEATRILWNGKPAILGLFSDITERKRSEDRAREMNLALAQAMPGIARVNLNGRYIEVNQPYATMLGYEPSELLGRAWEPTVHPEDLCLAQQAHDQLIANGKAEFECRAVRKDGSICFTQVLMVQNQLSVGGFLGHHCFMRDITERKQSEKALADLNAERTAALRASEERYARATAIGKVGVWEWDVLNGHYYGDDNLKALFGYASEELSVDPASWLNLVHPDDRSIARKNRDLVRTGTSDLVHYELRMLKKDGSIVWTDVRGMSVRNSDGQLTHLIGATVDITERKEAEEALRESEERFAKAFRASPHPVGITELATGRCIEVNDACLQLFGFSREEVIGQTTLSLGIWPKEEDRARLVARLSAGEPVHNLEMSVRTKSGDLRHVLVSSDVAELNGTPCLITVGNDVTDRKRAAEALQRSERDLRTVLDALPIGVWFTDRNGKPILSNPASEKIWTSAKEVEWGAGERKWTESTEHTTGPHRWALSKVLAQGEPSLNEIFELDCGDEGRKTILNSAVPVRDETGMVLGAVVLNEDISDRVQAEEALRISEERFAKAFRASLHPVVISELDSGRVMDANDAAYQLFGYTREDVVERTTLQIGLWHSGEERARYLELLKREGSIRNVEVKLRSKSGEIRQCLLSSELIELNGKQCSVTVGDDITDRKRAESTLKRSEERFRSIFHNAGTGIAFANAEGQYLQCNPAFCAIVGYSEEELSRKTFHDLIHPDEHAATVEVVDKLTSNEIPFFEVENRFLHKDGHAVLVHRFVTALRGEDNRLTHFIALVTDISERKQAEAELQRSHTFLRQVIDTDPDLIFAKDREGRFALANRAVAEWYGTTVDDLIGKSDADFNPNVNEVESFRQSDLEVITSGQDRFIPEERITDVEGMTHWLQTVKRPLFDEQGQVHLVLGAATDITERKRMEEMLLQRERDLSVALHERERISQDLHDGILQALYAIGLGLEGCKPLILKQHDRTAPKVMTGLNRAIGQLNHVMAEVRNFIAGLESHVMQGGDFPTALRSMVQTMCNASSVKCRVNIDNAAARHISTVQALHIINIVREGLSNSLRHSGATCITVSFRPLIRSIRLTVTDDGVGFDPHSIQGLGHGLTNMAARARKVGGSFTVQSEPHKGTKILLDLPKDITYDSN